MSVAAMPEAAATCVAGIPIVHRVGAGIALGNPRVEGWLETGCADHPVIIEHGVGDAGVEGLTEVLAVHDHATYYADASGGTAVRVHGVIPGVSALKLQTLAAGRHYGVHYQAAPAVPVPRMVTELPAFALTLGARRGGLLAHGCGFVLPSGGVAVCVGHSGAGKSTLAGLLAEVAGVRVLNDDRMVVTCRDGRAHAWSTPWPGRGGTARPGDGRLAVVGVIARSASPRVERLEGRAALAALLQSLALPIWDQAAALDGLAITEAIHAAVPIVRLSYPLAPASGSWVVSALEDAAR